MYQLGRRSCKSLKRSWRRRALPPNTADPQSKANDLARFRARGAETRYQRMPFRPARKVEAVNLVVGLSRSCKRVGKYFGGCKRRGTVELEKVRAKALRGPYHSAGPP